MSSSRSAPQKLRTYAQKNTGSIYIAKNERDVSAKADHRDCTGKQKTE